MKGGCEERLFLLINDTGDCLELERKAYWRKSLLKRGQAVGGTSLGPSSMRPSLSLFADSAEEAGLQVGDVVLAVTARRSPVWSTQEAVHLARKGRWSAVGPGWLCEKAAMWNSRKYQHEEEEARRMGTTSLLSWDYRELALSSTRCLRDHVSWNHVSVPCSFRIDGCSHKSEISKWSKKNVLCLLSIHLLKLLAMKIPLQGFISWVSFFLFPFPFFFFLFFFL